MYAKSATTIANILEAAQELFVSKNYKDVTMAEIGERAAVTKGALYHHFASKEELYTEMMFAYLARLKALLQTAVEMDGSAYDRLHKLTLNYLELPEVEQRLVRLVRRDINIFENPARADMVRAYQEALPQQVEAIVRDGVQAGEIIVADARLLAWEHVAMVEVVLSTYARKMLGSPVEMTNFVMRIYYQGVGQAN